MHCSEFEVQSIYYSFTVLHKIFPLHNALQRKTYLQSILIVLHYMKYIKIDIPY